MATLKLSKTDAEIIEHRLTAGCLGDVAADTFLEDGADAERDALMARVDAVAESVEHRLPRPLRACTITVATPLEAWCAAECVEGSTWGGAGGFDDGECRRLERQVEQLRQRLNANAGFVALLGREVAPTAELTEESNAVTIAMTA